MAHATEADRHKLPEMSHWFEQYMASASPAEVRAVRAEVRKLWPLCAVLLMLQAESSNPEVSAAALLELEKMKSLREGGKN
jgi:hypothetical protein